VDLLEQEVLVHSYIRTAVKSMHTKHSGVRNKSTGWAKCMHNNRADSWNQHTLKRRRTQKVVL